MFQEQVAAHVVGARPLQERIGLAIKNGVQSRYTAKEVIEKIKEAEEAGVQHIWMPQSGPLDTLTIFTAAALQTQQLRLNVGVVPTYIRHPLLR